MLSDCRISGFADEINKDFDIQLSVLKELGQEYVCLLYTSDAADE